MRKERRKCAFEECNKYIPLGKREETLYCSPNCAKKAEYRRKLKKEGKELTWRGVRRPGL
jgi:hypothetical protein